MTQANFKRGKLTISQCFIKYKIFLKLMFHSYAILLHWRNGSRKICDDIRLQSKAKYGQITQNCQRQFYVGSFCLLNVLSRRGGGGGSGRDHVVVFYQFLCKVSNNFLLESSNFYSHITTIRPSIFVFSQLYICPTASSEPTTYFGYKIACRRSSISITPRQIAKQKSTFTTFGLFV